MRQKYKRHITGLALVIFSQLPGFIALGLTESDFENIVRNENGELNSLYKKMNALKNYEEEAELVYGWQLNGGINQRVDKSPTVDPSFTYETLSTTQGLIGIGKVFSFGLETQLSLDSTRTEIVNGGSGGVNFNSDNWLTRPTFDLKLPLLSGGFGRKLRAEQQAHRLQKRIESLDAESTYTRKMNEAKTLLWSTVLQKESLSLQNETLQRIERIYKVVSKKTAQNLEASSNYLQTRSALEQTQFNLKMAELKFSQLERLLKLALKRIEGLVLPKYDFNKFKKTNKSDLEKKIKAEDLMLSLSSNLESQSAVALKEESLAKLDLYASFSLTGLEDEWSDSWDESQTGRFPTNLVGIKWAVPLDFGITHRSRQRQNLIAKAALDKKLYFENEQRQATIDDLVSRKNQMVDLLELNLKLERTQFDKLKNERSLLNQGRSSIYQVLQFELDLARAQETKFSLALDLENLQQQIELYRYESYE